MKLELIKPIKALNKAYLKEKVSRNHIELFKKNVQQLLSRINEQESEEHLKNVIADFLKDTWYKDQFEINTKDRNDLVIHSGKTTKDAVGVILEVKKPSNKAEMMTATKPNTKALQELILYYLRERVDHNNTDIKYLVVTNIYEWFVIDEVWFEKNVFRNSKLKKDYENWKLSGKDTKFFYDSIAKSFLDDVAEEMPVTYFDVRTYEKYVNNTDKEDDTKLIGLYKILSPAHLLKQPFINDSNSLDTKFYIELLHIIGLEEIKDGGKKLIKRKAKWDEASLLENTIIKLEDKDALRNISNLSIFGANKEEQLFNVALELCITWVNRVLFIKLLEAQLYKYHKGNKDYLFLNSKLVFDFDELSNLFYQVLAEKPASRRNHIQEKFNKVPYLNSSLFERIELERQTINISELDNRLQLPVSNSSVLKDDKGKRKAGTLPTLQYLFEFLDAYDFTSEGGEEIQEENKNLINASVLGLIFEKINGYKDGSFFTPGFVTMYMCKETIRRSVLQKFNDTKGWQCDTIDSLYNKIDDKKDANKIINSLHICDPAVGSGHFLVSALNEMIAIKSELKILQDATGKSLRDYHVEVVNDELIITDEDGKLFDYNPQNKESQRIQETLFHEKETIIENCLFGVDINPNSVKICRLRLWIELLKNAYYTPASNYIELETLPNIDINIKCGNSLISRFALDADIKSALRNSKWSIDSYKVAVQTYRDAESKEQKRGMEELIDSIKKDFRSYISPNDPKFKKLSKLRGDLFNLSQTKELFDEGNKKNKDTKKKIDQLSNDITKLETEIGEIKNNKIYENAFEWRFEFPEVLNGEGDYIGFDMVIGNPPYIKVQELNYHVIDWYKENKKVAHKRVDISTLFFELSKSILKNEGFATLISSNQFLVTEYGSKLRDFLLTDFALLSMIDFGDLPIFDDALTYVSIFHLINKKATNFSYTKIHNIEDARNLMFPNSVEIDISNLSHNSWILSSNKNQKLIEKINQNGPLSKIAKCSYGIKSGADDVFIVSKKTIQSENLEPDCLLPLVVANNCKRYCYVDFDFNIIYPYLFRNNKTELLTESELSFSFPNTFNYLKSNAKILEQRKDSRKTFEDSNRWYSLTRFGQIETFKKEKIVFPGEQKNPKFSIDRNMSGFIGARVFAITMKSDEINIKYLLALLNSSLLGFIMKSTFPLKQGGYHAMTSTFVEKLPIIEIANQQPFINLVDEVLANKQQGKDTKELEDKIDVLVYELYNLTEEEIEIIENSKD
jgi:adenine-specific DNA-methyltransferase